MYASHSWYIFGLSSKTEGPLGSLYKTYHFNNKYVKATNGLNSEKCPFTLFLGSESPQIWPVYEYLEDMENCSLLMDVSGGLGEDGEQ